MLLLYYLCSSIVLIDRRGSHSSLGQSDLQLLIRPQNLYIHQCFRLMPYLVCKDQQSPSTFRHEFKLYILFWAGDFLWYMTLPALWNVIICSLFHTALQCIVTISQSNKAKQPIYTTLHKYRSNCYTLSQVILALGRNLAKSICEIAFRS